MLWLLLPPRLAPRFRVRDTPQHALTRTSENKGALIWRGLKETTTMPKLRHIAIAAEDPYATAEFYKQAFDFVEVRRTQPKDEGSSYGVFLSDGTINLAILRFGWDQGHGLDFRGLHHFGVLVEDVDRKSTRLNSS